MIGQQKIRLTYRVGWHCFITGGRGGQKI